MPRIGPLEAIKHIANISGYLSQKKKLYSFRTGLGPPTCTVETIKVLLRRLSILLAFLAVYIYICLDISPKGYWNAFFNKFNQKLFTDQRPWSFVRKWVQMFLCKANKILICYSYKYLHIKSISDWDQKYFQHYNLYFSSYKTIEKKFMKKIPRQTNQWNMMENIVIKNSFTDNMFIKYFLRKIWTLLKL